jgi:hypothetical protein
VESAERRFFAAWTPRMPPPVMPAPASQAPGGHPRSGDGHIIGLFPQPGAPR